MSLSPQHLVTPAQNTAGPGIVLIWAGWVWLAGVLLAATLAAWTGAPAANVAAAVALAASPALAGFLLFPHRAKPAAAAAWIGVWILAACGLVAGSGGVSSPAAVVFLIGPAFAAVLRPSWTPEAGAAAVLAYALSAWLSRFDAHLQLGALPELLAVVSIAFAAGMFAVGLSRRRPAAIDAAASRRIAEVSHDLRTPLTHILGFSELIERRMFGEIADRYVEYAGLIRRSGGHLLALVNDLLDLSKIDAGRYDLELERFDVRDIADEIVRLSADSAAKKEIALALSAPSAPVMVRADPSALRRMLTNTVGNAIKFTPEGGKVALTVATADGQLLLDTSDSGPGISQEDRARLGRAYERGSAGAGAEGTGLGLALVRALAELHGGAMSFHDAAEGGALVRLRLPVLAD